MVDYNRIWTKPGAIMIDSFGSAMKEASIEDMRKDLHWEEHGKVLPLAGQTAAQAVASKGGSEVTLRHSLGKAL